jgi:hypothetical protein
MNKKEKRISLRPFGANVVAACSFLSKLDAASPVLR